MQNIKERSLDDQDFMWSYGDVRTRVPSQAYRDGWDRIFGNRTDRKTVDGNSAESDE